MIFMYISDNVDGTACTQASASYSLPGKLITKCWISKQYKKPKDHVVNVVLISPGKLKIHNKTIYAWSYNNVSI